MIGEGNSTVIAVGFPKGRFARAFDSNGRSCRRLVALKLLPLLLIASGLIQCSSVDAFWYASPDFYFRGKEGEHTAARLNSHGVNHSIWAYTGAFTVMRGPCIVPLWDAEPPILNQQYVSLHWKIDAPEEMFPLKIHRQTLEIRSEEGNFTPKNVYTCDVEQGKVGLQDEFNDEASDVLILDRPACLVFRYYDLYFGKVEEFYFSPLVHSGDEPVDTPTVRFRSRRDYSYEPYEFPFMYMPVR